MSRNENNTKTDEQRQAKIRKPADVNDSQTIGHTPDKAEGDERTVDEALRKQERSK